MRQIVTTSLVAILAAISISACSSSSNASSNTTVDNSAAAASSAPADNSAAAAPADNSAAAPAAASADVPMYPGAVADTLPAAAGTPPPGGKSFSTADTPAKVQAWYTANVKNAVLKGSTPTGAMFLIGDAKTGTVILVQSDSGKTWILTGPASSVGK
jgi:hypothetical protein